MSTHPRVACLLLLSLPLCLSLHEVGLGMPRSEAGLRNRPGTLAFSEGGRIPLTAAVEQTRSKQLKLENTSSGMAASLAPALLGSLGMAACFRGERTQNQGQASKEKPASSNTPALAALALLPVSIAMIPLCWAFRSELGVKVQGLKQVLPKGFVEAISLILFSELGDKTFFVAGLFAMKTNSAISFVGSLGALASMTIIATMIGQIFHRVPTIQSLEGVQLDKCCAVAAFSYFGLTLLYEAWTAEAGNDAIESELHDAQEELEKKNNLARSSTLALIAQAFSLVFAAEVGDRSFFTTIAMSSAYSPLGVAAGAVAGHAVSTGVAVITGSYLAKVLSTRVINSISGSLFLVFALSSALGFL